MFLASTLRERGSFPAGNLATFCHSVSGSAPMLSRIRLECQLEEHTGCVNHLAFNDCGAPL
jgi:hypothetical protein